MVGLLKRKKTNREKNYSISNLLHGKRDMEKELDKMNESIVEARTANEELSLELQRSEAEVARLKGMLKESVSWLKPTFKYCTSDTKNQFKTAYQVACSAGEIEKGTTFRILRCTGINFGKKLSILNSYNKLKSR